LIPFISTYVYLQNYTNHVNVILRKKENYLYLEVGCNMSGIFKELLGPRPLTLILLTWRIWPAPNNASKWQMGFNLAFKGLISIQTMFITCKFHLQPTGISKKKLFEARKIQSEIDQTA